MEVSRYGFSELIYFKYEFSNIFLFIVGYISCVILYVYIFFKSKLIVRPEPGEMNNKKRVFHMYVR